MKQAILTVGLIILVLASFSQSGPSKHSEPFMESGCIEIPPKYPGGHRAMVKLCNDNTRYALIAGNKRIGGTVVVTYKVDTFGNTTDIKLLKGVREDLDQEAMRLIRLLKRWTPATLNGKKIDYYNTQPFIFIPDK